MKSQNILFEKVGEIARLAGLKILEVRATGQNLGVTDKADGSPVTKADMAAHQLILRELQAVSSLPVLSEEGGEEIGQGDGGKGAVAWDMRKKWNEFWLVDPLDGTKDFIQGTGDYTVNIALIRDHRPIWGAVYCPEKGDLYTGGQSVGSFKNGHPLGQLADEKNSQAWVQKKQNVVSQSLLKKVLVVSDFIAVESHFHSSEKNQQFYKEFGIKHVFKVGSSLKFCQLAARKADIYPRLSPTNEWDTAAGQAVLEGAGGQVLSWPNLKPMPYHKQSFRNSEFIAFSAKISSLLQTYSAAE